MPRRRPNFIVFITDQHRADYLGCAGHPFLDTPAIDSLAAEGTRFTRFYASSPVCMPNRATFMTGRLPSVNGARGNGLPLSMQANTFVELMRAKGYRTGLIGKCHLMSMGPFPAHWKPQIEEGLEPPEGDLAEATKPWMPEETYDQENAANWSAHANWKLSLPFYGFERVHLCTGHGDHVGGEYEHWMRKKGLDLAVLTGPKNALPSDVTVPQAWRTALPEEVYPTSYVREHACRTIEDWGRSDEPFFLQVSFPDPHHPFTPPGKYWDKYKPEQAVLPRSFHARAANESGPVRWAQQAAGEKGFNPERTIFFLPVDERQAREAIALTCGMISMVDDAIAEILATLARTGCDRDTVILFTADHGDFLGDHGLLLKGPLHFQSTIKVPFIWRDPDRRGVPTCDAVAGTIDLSETILARAGLAGFNGMQGRSLLAEIATGRDHGRGVHIVEEECQRPMFGLMPPVRLRTLVTGDWRMTLYQDIHAELYNLKDDPDELVNLWDDPAHVATRAELLTRLVREDIRALDRSPAPKRAA